MSTHEILPRHSQPLVAAGAAREEAAQAMPGPAMAADQPLPSRGFYAGLNLPDLAEARAWRPGKQGLTGSQANERITATYTTLDAAMTRYLGQPAVPNWTTFGKFASQNAGNQIIRLETYLKADIRKDFGAAVPMALEFLRHPIQTFRQSKALFDGTLSPRTFAENTQLLRNALVQGNTQIIIWTSRRPTTSS